MTPPGFPSPPPALTIAGFTLGHGTDREALTGATVILCPEGALAAAEVRALTRSAARSTRPTASPVCAP